MNKTMFSKPDILLIRNNTAPKTNVPMKITKTLNNSDSRLSFFIIELSLLRFQKDYVKLDKNQLTNRLLFLHYAIYFKIIDRE